MAASAIFKIGDFSPCVEYTLEDPLDLRPNPSEEGEDDVGACQQRALDGNKDEEN